MENISTRTNYLNIESVDNNAEYDLGSLDFDEFNFGTCKYLAVRKQDVGRPDLLSYRAYNTSEYWWFILSFNNFCDPWNDIVENQIIKYPTIDKVKEFLRLRLDKTKDNRKK